MDPTELAARKRHLRAALKASRPPARPLQAGLDAQRRLVESGLLARAAVVALFDPLPSEVPTERLAAALVGRGARVVYPRVVPGEVALDLHDPRGGWTKGPLGLREPREVPGSRCSLAAVEAFVVSALAFDPAGRRLGRGRGHYDATLAAAPSALRVLLCWDDLLVPEVPVGDHDRAMDAVCTEARLLLFPARAEARP